MGLDCGPKSIEENAQAWVSQNGREWHIYNNIIYILLYIILYIIYYILYIIYYILYIILYYIILYYITVYYIILYYIIILYYVYSIYICIIHTQFSDFSSTWNIYHRQHMFPFHSQIRLQTAGPPGSQGKQDHHLEWSLDSTSFDTEVASRIYRSYFGHGILKSRCSWCHLLLIGDCEGPNLE